MTAAERQRRHRRRLRTEAKAAALAARRVRNGYPEIAGPKGAIYGRDALRKLVDSGARFGCLYIDPPWEYENGATRAAARNH